MAITIKPLDNGTGYYHIQGTGSCNWCQVPRWPATADEIAAGMFPEAGDEFRREVQREANRVIETVELMEGEE